MAAVLAMVCLVASSPRADARDRFESIFDGKSLNGWRGNNQFWSVRDGAITGETTEKNPTDHNTFLIFQSHVGDFELRLKMRILAGNSGIQYRSIDLGDAVVQGYQADMDAEGKFIGDLYEERGRGLLAKWGEKIEIGEDGKRVVVGKTTDRDKVTKAMRWGDWNEYRVVAKGPRLVQQVNGFKTTEVVDRELKKSRAEGILALQLHAGPPMLVQFKDISLKRLR
jgi:hypothetical protein